MKTNRAIVWVAVCALLAALHGCGGGRDDETTSADGSAATAAVEIAAHGVPRDAAVAAKSPQGDPADEPATARISAVAAGNGFT